MKRSTLVSLLLVICILQSVQIARQGLGVYRQWRQVHSLSNQERRLHLWGEFYSETIRIETQIPKVAMVQWDSKEYPWYCAYYLYPRLLVSATDTRAGWTLHEVAARGHTHMEATPR